VLVPREVVAVTYARSSGAGGQHVNKVSTKACMRVDVSEASVWWLPPDVRQRLLIQQRGLVTKSGELVVACDEMRSQRRNLALGLERLQRLVTEACFVPKEFVNRKTLDEPQGIAKVRVKQKREHAHKKERRRSGPADF